MRNMRRVSNGGFREPCARTRPLCDVGGRAHLIGRRALAGHPGGAHGSVEPFPRERSERGAPESLRTILVSFPSPSLPFLPSVSLLNPGQGCQAASGGPTPCHDLVAPSGNEMFSAVHVVRQSSCPGVSARVTCHSEAPALIPPLEHAHCFHRSCTHSPTLAGSRLFIMDSVTTIFLKFRQHNDLYNALSLAQIYQFIIHTARMKNDITLCQHTLRCNGYAVTSSMRLEPKLLARACSRRRASVNLAGSRPWSL